MAFYYNHLDENGNLVEEKVRLLPTSPALPAGHSWTPYVPSLELRKQQIKQQIMQIRDTKLANGGFKVGDKWFHSDTFSRTQQLALTMLGNNLPNNIDWKTMDKSKIRLTPQVVQQLFGSAVTQDNSIFSYAETLTEAVMAAEDPSTIDINAGWPETFQ
jgi:hypothetical protein